MPIHVEPEKYILVSWRKAHSFTQSHMARLLQVQLPTYQRWEQTAPKYETLTGFALMAIHTLLNSTKAEMIPAGKSKPMPKNKSGTRGARQICKRADGSFMPTNAAAFKDEVIALYPGTLYYQLNAYEGHKDYGLWQECFRPAELLDPTRYSVIHYTARKYHPTWPRETFASMRAMIDG